MATTIDSDEGSLHFNDKVLVLFPLHTLAGLRGFLPIELFTDF